MAGNPGERNGRPRTLLERLLWQEEYSYEEMTKRFEALALELDERATMTARHLRRLAAGERTRATPSTRRVLRAMFGHPADILLAPILGEATPAGEPSSRAGGGRLPLSTACEAPVRSLPVPDLSRWPLDPVPGDDASCLSEREFEMAAEESALFVRRAARTVTSDVIEQLDGDVQWLAREYLRRPPYTLFRALARLRADVFGMIDARPHPQFLTDLYRVGGRLTALLAHASSDLGQLHAADSHARSALLCADYAGDLGLAAYVRWIQSNAAYWRGDYTIAADLARAGLDIATAGNDVLRLSSQQARAHAAAGQHRECETALTTAGEVRDRLSSEPRPGGVFSFPLGKAAYYASEVRQALGGPKNARRAVSDADEALVLLASDHETEQAHELHAATRLDLVTAHLSLGELDQATAHTEAVLALPAENRTMPIIGRMGTAHQALRSAPFGNTPAALDLSERVETFIAYPAARELPA